MLDSAVARKFISLAGLIPKLTILSLFLLPVLLGCSETVSDANSSTDAKQENPSIKRQTTETTKATRNSSSVDYALSFDGKDDYVEIPTLKYDGSHPLTVELIATPRSIRPKGTATTLNRTPS